MAHFSASADSIASLFIVARIGFEPCNNYTLSCSFCQIAGPGYLLLVQDAVLLITVLITVHDITPQKSLFSWHVKDNPGGVVLS